MWLWWLRFRAAATRRLAAWHSLVDTRAVVARGGMGGWLAWARLRREPSRAATPTAGRRLRLTATGDDGARCGGSRWKIGAGVGEWSGRGFGVGRER